MGSRVVVVNGGSSAGTTTLCRELQSALLPKPWLTTGIDVFVDSLPLDLQASPEAFAVDDRGAVVLGDVFRRLEAAWMAGVAATARAGADLLVDDVFLGGVESQQRWRRALAGLDVVWVGVRCAPDVAERREAARPDRPGGMARSQALRVHHGVSYDVEVDTTATAARACAEHVMGFLRHR
ncbi:chloramphenicol phosphotransferase CPT family protein [Motilibacter deserti]|uniref:Chloramphenicol phosphotransferase n=1 Tax=Motilibacter deserti TaxID=2714956 RepID=A0ABX0GPX2_9ACTN|nr:chloramphenicol phosphotransferase [Motilibacter deserti]NHC12535.1 chloramphenicol phosphotransferase [Motilibacter deserti]